jgi:hypothetical protein
MKKTYRFSRYSQWLFVLLFILNLPALVLSEERTTVNPYKVEAAFLRNFARYVTWPDQTFSVSDSPWCVGILGQDPFGDILEVTFKGRIEKGRSFEIFRANMPDELPPCQIVFVSYRDVEKRRAALLKLKNKPVLTVSNAPDFLNEGGIILLEAKDRVHMSINLDQARAVSLTIQTKMLEVSQNVIENGVLRKAR